MVISHLLTGMILQVRVLNIAHLTFQHYSCQVPRVDFAEAIFFRDVGRDVKIENSTRKSCRIFGVSSKVFFFGVKVEPTCFIDCFCSSILYFLWRICHPFHFKNSSDP